MVSAEEIPSISEINDLRRLPDLEAATDAKGVSPALATMPLVATGSRGQALAFVYHLASVSIRACSKKGLTSAPRLPQTLQTNRCSISESRRWFGQQSAERIIECVQRWSPQKTTTPLAPDSRISPKVNFCSRGMRSILPRIVSGLKRPFRCASQWQWPDATSSGPVVRRPPCSHGRCFSVIRVTQKAHDALSPRRLRR